MSYLLKLKVGQNIPLSDRTTATAPGQQVLMLEPKSLSKVGLYIGWLNSIKRHVKASSDTREAPKIRKDDVHGCFLFW